MAKTGIEGGLFDLMRKTQEAYCVRAGIPVARKFSDVELTDSMQGLAEAERELYGDGDARQELVGPLSAAERKILGDLDRRMMGFRVTVAMPNAMPETVNLMALHSCEAVTKALELMFPDFDSEKPVGILGVKVEPISAKTRRAA